MRNFNLKNIYCLVIIYLLSATLLQAQDLLTISGTIIDADTKENLPFAALGFKNHLKGTTTNENGEFIFTFPKELVNDSLIINYLGYQPKAIAVTGSSKSLVIKVSKESVSLDEFVVLPQPPEYYIKMAVRDIPKNYPTAPIQSYSYYQEKIAENNVNILLNECVFKSYAEDTISEHQLVLYKKTENEVTFMKKQREKEERKAQKKNKNSTDEKTTEEEKEDFKITDFFGGPKQILNAANINKLPPFMDSLRFNEFNYSYDRNISYSGKNVMEIKFSSKKRKDKYKGQGVVYIDRASNAIVALDFSGDIRLPALLKPILFVLGIGLKRPQVAIKKQYQERNGYWYVSNCKVDIKLNFTKKKMFRKNEHSLFQISQLYNINDILLENPLHIESSKQFDFKNKDYNAQIHNDFNMNWNQINRIN